MTRITGFYWVLLGLTMFNQDYWVLLGFTGFYWVLLGFTEFHGGSKNVTAVLSVERYFVMRFDGNLLGLLRVDFRVIHSRRQR